MTRPWNRLPPHRKRIVRSLFFLLLAVFVILTYYQSLQAPKHAAAKVVEQNQQDNVTLCQYFQTTDRDLQRVFDANPTTDAGSLIRNSLVDVQQAARRVTESPICTKER